MKTVILAEKPSVARDIARILGASGKGKGLLQGKGYVVTWALGHLVHLAEPDEYGPSWKGRWSLETLPMVPEKWKLRTGKSTRDQYHIVKNLLNDADTGEIICATDAGREGEHIFRLIYQHSGCKKPFRRLWISSLTDRAIRQGLQNLQPGSAFDHLGQAARARAQADWLVGLNLTRAYTVHNKVLCTIGRVQTPTLAMIVQREEKIARFKKAYFYELVAHLKEGFRARYCKDGQTRIEAKERAEELYRRLSPHKEGTVTRVEKKIKKHRPPPLYDLTTLQREANQRYGFTASRTLEYAQSLYETYKLITYPRTESRHIAPDMVPRLPAVLEKLDHPQAPVALERLRQGHKLGKTYVDQTKLTDHHAILPTGQVPPPSLSPPLKKIYDLVVARFVAIFLPDNVVEETQVDLDIGGALFVAKGSLTLELGWKIATQPPAPRTEEEDQQQLPPLERGQQVQVASMEVVEKETKPPKRYTDATLLSAMKNAGRDIEDEALAEAMKESGLGTPATRAETIEKLIRSDLVQRDKKVLVPTEKGRGLIGIVAAPLKSPELTAAWEQKLKDIEEGRLQARPFYQSIVEFVNNLITQVPQSPALPPEALAVAAGPGRKGSSGDPSSALPPCPACGRGQIVETPKAYGCNRYKEGCPFTIWKSMAGKKLSLKQARDLIAKGSTGPLKGFKSKAGKKFAARLKMDEQFKVVFDFEDQPTRTAAAPNHKAQSSMPATANPMPKEAPMLTCPKCGRGQIIEGKRGFGCKRYKEGCDFVVWKEIASKKLTPKQVERLITKGKTTLLKGFANKGGRPFQARLKLEDDGRVGFEFPGPQKQRRST